MPSSMPSSKTLPMPLSMGWWRTRSPMTLQRHRSRPDVDAPVLDAPGPGVLVPGDVPPLEPDRTARDGAPRLRRILLRRLRRRVDRGPPRGPPRWSSRWFLPTPWIIHFLVRATASTTTLPGNVRSTSWWAWGVTTWRPLRPWRVRPRLAGVTVSDGPSRWPTVSDGPWAV